MVRSKALSLSYDLARMAKIRLAPCYNTSSLRDFTDGWHPPRRDQSRAGHHCRPDHAGEDLPDAPDSGCSLYGFDRLECRNPSRIEPSISGRWRKFPNSSPVQRTRARGGRREVRRQYVWIDRICTAFYSQVSTISGTSLTLTSHQPRKWVISI